MEGREGVVGSGVKQTANFVGCQRRQGQEVLGCDQGGAHQCVGVTVEAALTGAGGWGNTVHTVVPGGGGGECL